MFTKRGQSAAGAAVLLAIIMGLIILFIILLPPAERAKLLDESSTSNFSKTTGTSGVKTVNENLLRSNPGRLSYLSETSIDKVLSAYFADFAVGETLDPGLYSDFRFLIITPS